MRSVFAPSTPRCPGLWVLTPPYLSLALSEVGGFGTRPRPELGDHSGLDWGLVLRTTRNEGSVLHPWIPYHFEQAEALF
eukprot:3433814-Rhodomonas_salina.2